MARKVYHVSELCGLIDVALGDLFPANLWVEGEISGCRPAGRSGHIYFDLVEKDARGSGVRAKLGAALFRRARLAVVRKLRAAGDPFKLEDGIVIRARARVEFYPPHGKLQLIVDDVDLEYTVGRMQLSRAAIRDRLVRDGLLERQRRMRAPEVPLHVGLVTGRGTAAYRDFWDTIAGSRFGIQVSFCSATMEGPRTEREVVRAIRTLARLRPRPPDVIALIRGGGARDALAWFDSEAICRTIATLPITVICGIGHAIDLSLADEVSWRHEKTPTAVAEAIVAQVRRFTERRDALLVEIRDAARAVLERRGDRLAATARELGDGTRAKLAAEARSIDAAASDLGPAGRRLLERRRAGIIEREDDLGEAARRALRDAREAWIRAREELSLTRVTAGVRDRRRGLDALADRIGAASRDRLGRARTRADRAVVELAHPSVRRRVARLGERVDQVGRALAGEAERLLARRAQELARSEREVHLASPEGALARGFTITLGPDGRTLRRADAVAAGERITTRLAGGTIESVVSATRSDDGDDDGGSGERTDRGR